jgi:thiol:disulfide interchange protein DsbA
MKALSYGLAALLFAGLAVTGCGRHASNGARQASAPPAHRTGAAPVTVNAQASQGPTGERSIGMTEESEGPAEPPSGLSPIAAAVAANTPAPAAVIPAKWVDGKNYTALVPAQPTSVAPDKVEVVEVFWYGCGHCFHLDPTLEEWRKQGKPGYADFVRLPVMWNDNTRAHARLYYTLEALGKLDQLHTAVFREIHNNGHFLVDADPAKTEKLQREFLTTNGVSDADFDRTYRSFSVESKLQRAEQLTRRYKVTGVPLIVVNGKYTTDIAMAGGEAQLVSLIGDLAAAEHKR